MNPWLISIPLAYLLGSIPFGYLLVRFVRHEDIRAIGSGNIGATNVLRSGAKGLGLATLLLDLGKAFLAVELVKLYFAPGNFDLAVAAAVAAVLGHCYPVWLSFKGGKGVASALGVFLALTWPSALCILAVFLAVVALTRFVSRRLPPQQRFPSSPSSSSRSVRQLLSPASSSSRSSSSSNTIRTSAGSAPAPRTASARDRRSLEPHRYPGCRCLGTRAQHLARPPGRP